MKKTMEEIETDHQTEEMELRKWKMVAAEIRGQNEYGDFLCIVGDKKGLLPRKEQLFREQTETGEIVQAVVIDVIRKGNESIYVLSRTHPILLGALFRREVPEIGDGWIVIKGLARDTAGRAKVAVTSKRKDIDPVGACIGPGGRRVERVMKELSGEKIDIIKWSDRPEELIASALTPAKVKSVVCNLQKTEAVVEVEADQKAIAVGKGGLNIRLAGRLTRWGIRIK
jgi:N utilization substance protein A